MTCKTTTIAASSLILCGILVLGTGAGATTPLVATQSASTQPSILNAGLTSSHPEHRTAAIVRRVSASQIRIRTLLAARVDLLPREPYANQSLISMPLSETKKIRAIKKNNRPTNACATMNKRARLACQSAVSYRATIQYRAYMQKDTNATVPLASDDRVAAL